MELNTGKEQHSTMANDSLTNIGLSLYPIIIMGIASLVPIAFHFATRVSRTDFSRMCRQCRTRRIINPEPTWRNSGSFRFNPECCPICLSAPSLPLATNCGHIFCAACLRAVWRASRQHHVLTPYIACPMCRAKLYEILPVNPNEVVFSEVMAPANALPNENNYVTLYDFITMFNDTYQHIADPQTLVKRVWRFLVRNMRKVNKVAFRIGFQNPRLGVLLSLLTPILYVFQPENVIHSHETYGYVDDLLVCVLCTYPLVNYLKVLREAHRA